MKVPKDAACLRWERYMKDDTRWEDRDIVAAAAWGVYLSSVTGNHIDDIWWGKPTGRERGSGIGINRKDEL